MSKNRLDILDSELVKLATSRYWRPSPATRAILTQAAFFLRKGPASWLWYIRLNKMTLSLSIVVPAYNEGARLGKSLRAIVAYLNEFAPQSELIVVDDGSTDDTAERARTELAAAQNVHTSVISYQSNLGKGRAVRLGLLASRSDI